MVSLLLDRRFLHLQWHFPHIVRRPGLPFIGWANSPFRLEVGFASFGFGLVGLIASWRGFDMRLAAILGPSAFLWGAAGVHIYHMIVEHNFAPGNAGIIFWSDILVPIIGFTFLWLQHRCEREKRSAAPPRRSL
jgi:uncharacterized protein DUF6790